MQSSRADSKRTIMHIDDGQKLRRISSSRKNNAPRRPSTSASSSITKKSISEDSVCQCYCTERLLYPALQTEIDALKKVLVVKEKENQRAILYSDILQQEIEKLRMIIEKQSKDMNRSQRYLFTREATEKNLSLTITAMQTERKSAEILEAQNLELFQRINNIEELLNMEREKVIRISDELAQTIQIKEKLLEEAACVEATKERFFKEKELMAKRAEQRAEDAEIAFIALKQKVAKRDKEFLLRDEILMDKVSRSHQRAFETLAVANQMTDRYYAAKDASESNSDMVHVSNSRGAVIINRLERERELLRSRELQLTDENNFLQMQIVTLSREQTPAEFAHSTRTKTSQSSERRLSMGNKLAAITISQAVQTERIE